MIIKQQMGVRILTIGRPLFFGLGLIWIGSAPSLLVPRFPPSLIGESIKHIIFVENRGVVEYAFVDYASLSLKNVLPWCILGL